MGCGVSRVGFQSKDESVNVRRRDLRLTSSKLTFNHRQLLTLNEKFGNLLDCKSNSANEREKQKACLDVVVERLIQRLVCSVGNLDSRFSSKFLINLEPLKKYNLETRRILEYKYLVRLDLVSTPAIYPDFFEPPVRIVEGIDSGSLPEGFAKIRVHGEFLERWAGFISPSGFLRRDKIQERFIELLARAAAKPIEPFAPSEVDESKLCGSPGKVVDPVTLYHILKTPSRHRFYFGSAECNESRFPDPRDFRIAIVEGVPETRLHISFLSPTAQSFTADHDVEISIILGIEVFGWPSTSDFPFRFPLDHVDVILAYRAAQLNYYLVPKAPHSSVFCEDRYSLWEIRTFTSEMFLEHHYSPNSIIFKVYKILVYILKILKARGVKTINKYILKNLVFYELEDKKNLQDWAPKAMSRRILSILDRLLDCMRCQNVPSYIFSNKNLLLQDNFLENDCVSDGDILENYLKLLHIDGNILKRDDDEWSKVKAQMENVMLQKWENVIGSMLPPMSTRRTRLNVVGGSTTNISYTRQQIEYVAMLIREVLILRNIQRTKEISDNIRENDFDDQLKNREDFLYLLQIMFDQAKQKFLNSAAFRSRSKLIQRSEAIKLDQVALSYDISTAMIVDDVKRSKDVTFRFVDDISIVVRIMEYLYKAIDSDGRILGPVLRPYLNQIFRGSHENCWFLPEWKKKIDLSEIRAMEAFGNLVLSGKIEPFDGILDAANKGWSWAISCLKIIQTINKETSTRLIVGDKIDANESGLRLIFAPEPRKTIRFNVTSVQRGNLRFSENSSGFYKMTLGSNSIEVDGRYSTIKSFRGVLDSSESLEKENSPKYKGWKNLIEKQPLHIVLRDENPFTVASMEARRQGNHRGLGSVIQALISLQKLTVLQEISQYLPENERIRVLSDIKKLSKEVQRLTVENYRKKYFSPLGGEKNRFSFKKPTKTHQQKNKINFLDKEKSKAPQVQEVYRNIDEFASQKNSIPPNLKAKEDKSQKELEESKSDSLLGTCRLLRQQHRPTVFDLNALHTLPQAAERHKRSSSNFSKSIINTPFYIKVSSFRDFNSKSGGQTTKF